MISSSFFKAVCCTFMTLPFLHAYVIDTESCKGEQYTLLQTAIKEAFSMADYAVTALEREPVDDNVQRLANLLFGENADTIKARETFRGILERRTMLDNPYIENVKEIVFYCNMDRMQLRDPIQGGTKRYQDPLGGYYFEDPSGGPIEECRSSKDATLAVTLNPKVRSVGGRPRASPSQITICPWFMEWATRAKYNTFATTVKAKLAKAVIPLATKNPFNWPLTPIDSLGLLEKVILHELTHTVAGKELIDVQMDKGWLPGHPDAYGWSAATRLAKEGGVDEKSPFRNADTLALFGSGVRLLNDVPPRYIQDDGKVTSTRISLKKRAMPHNFELQRTPAASESFITIIREPASAVTEGVK